MPVPRKIREGLRFHLDKSTQPPPKSSPTGLPNRPKKGSIMNSGVRPLLRYVPSFLKKCNTSQKEEFNFSLFDCLILDPEVWISFLTYHNIKVWQLEVGVGKRLGVRGAYLPNLRGSTQSKLHPISSSTGLPNPERKEKVTYVCYTSTMCQALLESPFSLPHLETLRNPHRMGTIPGGGKITIW